MQKIYSFVFSASRVWVVLRFVSRCPHSSFTGWTPRSSEVWLNSQRINMHIWNEKQKNQKGFLILSLQFWPKNPYFRLDNFPFFSSDFPVRNFSSTNFPFSRFSWEIAMPNLYQFTFLFRLQLIACHLLDFHWKCFF